MDLYYKQEVTVGLLVIIAIGIFVGGLMWLSDIPLFGGRDRIGFQVRFTNVAGLSEGDPVQMSGLQVGRVTGVQLEDVGRVIVGIQLNNARWRPHVDASASVRSLDFLGSKYVEYSPGQAPDLLAEGQSIQGSQQQDVLANASELADQAATVLTGVQAFLDPAIADQLVRTLQATEEAMGVVRRLEQSTLMDQADSVMLSLRNVASRIDSTVANPAITQSINQLDDVMLSVQEMADGLAGATTALGAIMTKMDEGQGSIGMMLNDSTLHTDMHELLVSLRLLLDDMRERPGRYFRLKVF